MKKLILIDGNALVHRAFHALPPMTAPDGTMTNAVYGFCTILMKALKDIQPEYVAATFDLAGPTFRHEEFAEYKIHRVKAPQELYDQIPVIKSVLTAFGIPIFERQGYEADDVIGSLAVAAKKTKDLQVIIATGDMDTLQLVDSKRVNVFTLRKGMADTVIYDEAAVMERFGLKPEQLNDYKGLKGDPSDNIPGVPGVGEKTASTLIQTFGSLEALYKKLEATEKIEGISDKLREKLLTNKEQAFFSKQLSVIVTDLEIDWSLEKMCWREQIDVAALKKRFMELGFNSLSRRIDELLGTAGAAPAQPTLLENIPTPIEIPAYTNGAFKNVKAVALAMDTDALYLCIENKNAVRLLWEKIATASEIMTDSNIAKIGHDLKPIARKLLENEIQLAGIAFDSKLAAYILNYVIRDYPFADVYRHATKKEADRGPAFEATAAFELRDVLEKELIRSPARNVLEEIEIPLITVLAAMENRGIAVNTDIVRRLLIIADKEISELEKKIYALAGQEFNINSPQQLGGILFDTLKITGRVRKTGGGARSTAAPELEKLRDENPIIDLILQYREIQKLRSTYIEPFPALLSPRDGRLHTTYIQTGAITGRLASQDPNLQNIPIRTELGQEFRKAFVAAPGYTLVSLDYSQIELRIAAHMARDPVMTQAFINGEDIHTRTAAKVFDVEPTAVTKDMRRQAKVLNFGIMYGMGVMGFARAANVDRTAARQFMDKYFKEFAGIARYMEEMKQFAHKHGYVDTLFGRRRLLPDIRSTMPMLRASAERMAINMPMQGTQADIVKMAMNAVHADIEKRGVADDVRMLLQIHDELLFEIKKDLVTAEAKHLKKIMETVCTLDVPVIVEIKIGPNWAEVQKLKE